MRGSDKNYNQEPLKLKIGFSSARFKNLIQLSHVLFCGILLIAIKIYLYEGKA